jgi:hypothetical protein
MIDISGNTYPAENKPLLREVLQMLLIALAAGVVAAALHV